jgi:hypothetical protein
MVVMDEMVRYPLINPSLYGQMGRYGHASFKFRGSHKRAVSKVSMKPDTNAPQASKDVQQEE